MEECALLPLSFMALMFYIKSTFHSLDLSHIFALLGKINENKTKRKVEKDSHCDVMLALCGSS